MANQKGEAVHAQTALRTSQPRLRPTRPRKATFPRCRCKVCKTRYSQGSRNQAPGVCAVPTEAGPRHPSTASKPEKARRLKGVLCQVTCTSTNTGSSQAHAKRGELTTSPKPVREARSFPASTHSCPHHHCPNGGEASSRPSAFITRRTEFNRAARPRTG